MERPHARIVVGYNGSDTARAVVAHAARRARGHGKLVVVHACQPSAPLERQAQGQVACEIVVGGAEVGEELSTRTGRHVEVVPYGAPVPRG